MRFATQTLMGRRMSTGEVPAIIDRYQLVERIGKGGMAQVFHARLQGLGGFERDVAVKVLLPEYASEPDFIDMLLDEARIAGAILHPCVIQVLDVGRAEDLFYLVMEYVDGSDLRTILKSSPRGRLALPTALYVVGEVLRGLDAVHGAVDRDGQPRRIVHRDVSPANVLVDRAGVVKLGDFGIAHATSRLTRTRNGAVKGKLRYMAPEQQVAALPVDHRADLYAVGIMLCEMLLGADACEPRRASVHGPVFSWARSRDARSIPADLAHILDHALAEDPARRYPSAAAFRRDVAAALHRREPGYSSTELARDLAPLAIGSSQPQHVELATAPEAVSPRTDADLDPPPSPFDGSYAGGLFSEEQKPTAPFRQIFGSEAPFEQRPTAPFRPITGESPLPPVAEPFASLPNDGVIRPRGWRRMAYAGAGALASVVAIALAIALGTASSAAPILPPAAVSGAPLLPSQPVSRPATGTLSVEGPRGALVMIGSTAYPPAPCTLELPAGQYQIKLRKGRRARVVTRSVEIHPGRSVTLRL